MVRWARRKVDFSSSRCGSNCDFCMPARKCRRKIVRSSARKRECGRERKQDSIGENALARALLLSFPGACWACTWQCPHVSNIIQQLGHLNLCIAICTVLLFSLWLLLCEPCTKTYFRKSQLPAKCTTSLSLSLFLSLCLFLCFSFSVSVSPSLCVSPTSHSTCSSEQRSGNAWQN